MNIGNTLKELRKQHNLTQEDVARELSITRQAYCRYENDQRELSIDMLCKIADFYEESTDSILGRKQY